MLKPTTTTLVLPFMFICMNCSDPSESYTPSLDEQTVVHATPLNETFDSFASGEIWNEGTTHGKWKNIFSGYGTVGVQSVAAPWGKVLFEKPKVSTSSGETHASMVISSPGISINDFSLTASVQTYQQLRQNSAPNAWECVWVIWHYRYEGNFHKFYYIAAKPNGWEFGKTDPAYPGGQRFLRTGSTPKFGTKIWHKIKISQTGSTISIWMNDIQVVNKFYDNERPYKSGPVGFYSEDAHILVDNVLVTTP